MKLKDRLDTYTTPELRKMGLQLITIVRKTLGHGNKPSPKLKIRNGLVNLYGQYDYEVYEQASTSNTNPAGLNMIESGIMELVGTPFEFTEYSTTDTYTIRQ